jgi:hypothetical protein
LQAGANLKTRHHQTMKSKNKATGTGAGQIIKSAIFAGGGSHPVRQWSKGGAWAPVAIRRGARGGFALSAEARGAVLQFVQSEIERLQAVIGSAAIVGGVVPVGGSSRPSKGKGARVPFGVSSASVFDSAQAVEAMREINSLISFAAGYGIELPGNKGKGKGGASNPERAAFEAARAASEAAQVEAELRKARALRAAAEAEPSESFIPLGAGKTGLSRVTIEKGGAAGDEERRECLASFRQRLEMSGAALAEAAGRLGERFGHRWVTRKEMAMGLPISFQTRQDVVSIFRFAGISEVMAGNVSGLLGCRHAVKAARRAASSEIRKAGGRDGIERKHSMADGFDSSASWERRDEWSGQGRVSVWGLWDGENLIEAGEGEDGWQSSAGYSSAPDRSAGVGLRPSIASCLQDWALSVRESMAEKVKRAATPQAKSQASKGAGRAVDLVAGLLSYAQGGAGPDSEILAPFFRNGETSGALSEAGRVRLHRLRAALV